MNECNCLCHASEEARKAIAGCGVCGHWQYSSKPQPQTEEHWEKNKKPLIENI